MALLLEKMTFSNDHEKSSDSQWPSENKHLFKSGFKSGLVWESWGFLKFFIVNWFSRS